jgi:hypothetical protein
MSEKDPYTEKRKNQNPEEKDEMEMGKREQTGGMKNEKEGDEEESEKM